MRLFAAFLALLLLLPPLTAAADPGDLPIVHSAEAYLNGLVTLRARFTQTANDGATASGDFLLKRPGRLRFQYDKPVTDFIVADGMMIYYYDGQMKQQSSAPISKSLADFFLRKKLNLSGDIRVSDVKREDGKVLLTLVQAKDPLSGSLTLVLNENPMELKEWRVVDAQGLTTKVALSDAVTGIKLKDSYFHYYDPERKDPSYNR
ncbi:MAG: outer membrane lipoprotein carrier protein LolA [Alphaproteobacteria bacterium]|nr:MAG: outer membrane lipoprotein carrier protein LolA [Alphaproteobacteria bacterium]